MSAETVRLIRDGEKGGREYGGGGEGDYIDAGYADAVVECFYIVLFCALEQPHCTLVACDSTWVTAAFFIVHLFEFPSRWCTSVPHYLVVKWLVPCETAAISVHILCTPYNHAPVYSVTTKGACVFSCILPPALSAEWLGSFICFGGNTGVEGYRNKSQHRKLTLEKKILLLLCQDSNPWPFITSLVLNHWAIPAPQVLCGKRVDCVINRREERLF